MFSGNVDLPRLLPFLGKSQLQVLSVVVSLLLLGGHILMATLVKEKVLLKTFSADGWGLPCYFTVHASLSILVSASQIENRSPMK